MVSLAAASKRTVVRNGLMKGGQPKANAKTRRKLLQMPGWVALLRRCTSRLSQRAIEGPKKPMSESEKKWEAPRPAKSGACRRKAATPRATRTTPTMTPARRLSLMSAPMRWRPKRRIKAPAIGARRARFWRKKEPTALAEAPKETKTTEKPATKARADENRPEALASPLRSCSMPMPESIET